MQNSTRVQKSPGQVKLLDISPRLIPKKGAKYSGSKPRSTHFSPNPISAKTAPKNFECTYTSGIKNKNILPAFSK